MEEEEDGSQSVAFLIHQLPWRSDMLTELFLSLDHKHGKKQSKKSTQMTLRRYKGEDSTRPVPHGVPTWCIKESYLKELQWVLVQDKLYCSSTVLAIYHSTLINVFWFILIMTWFMWKIHIYPHGNDDVFWEINWKVNIEFLLRFFKFLPAESWGLLWVCRDFLTWKYQHDQNSIVKNYAVSLDLFWVVYVIFPAIRKLGNLCGIPIFPMWLTRFQQLEIQ